MESIDDVTTEATARAAQDEISTITWRPFDREDLPAIAAFYALVEAHDNNPERTSLADLQDFWDSPRSVPERDTLIGLDANGRVVATAWAGCNRSITEQRTVFLGGAVHPEARGEGLGRRILAWEMAHGRAWDATTREEGYGPLVMRLPAPVEQNDVRHLAERARLPVVRRYFEMSRPLQGLPEPRQLDGIRIASWDPLRSNEILQVINAAFRDHWGHADASPQMWADQIGAQAFRPEWSLLAIDERTNQIVGAALNCAYEQDWRADHQEGYTDQLGVLRQHRGRGIASALLIESMHRFAADGMHAACLGVDTENPSGALALYESLGYATTASTCIHQATMGRHEY